MNEIDYIIEKEKHAEYISLVNELSNKYSINDIAASALSLAFSNSEVEDLEEIGLPDFSSGKNNVRLFMTIGRRDNVKVSDIVRTIAAGANIPGNKIGNIALFDKFSFVEVPYNIAEKVIKTVDNTIMYGRKIRIQPARERKR